MSPDQVPVRLRSRVSQLWSRAWEPVTDRRHEELSAWLGLDGLSTEEVLRAERMRRRGKQPRFVADRLLAARARAARSRPVVYRPIAPTVAPETPRGGSWALRRPSGTDGWTFDTRRPGARGLASYAWSVVEPRTVLRWGAKEDRPGPSNVDPNEPDLNQDGAFVHLRVGPLGRSPRQGDLPATPDPRGAP